MRCASPLGSPTVQLGPDREPAAHHRKIQAWGLEQTEFEVCMECSGTLSRSTGLHTRAPACVWGEQCLPCAIVLAECCRG